MIARFTEANATNANFADKKFPAHQMIQGHIASHDVAAGVPGNKFDGILTLQSFNRLRLNQREFEVRLGLEECALLKGVPISFEPDTWNENRVIQRLYRRRRGSGDMDGLYFSVPHRNLLQLLIFFNDSNRLFENIDG